MKFPRRSTAFLFWLNVSACVLNLSVALFFADVLVTGHLLLAFMTATLNGILVLMLWPRGK